MKLSADRMGVSVSLWLENLARSVFGMPRVKPFREEQEEKE